ncbi:hypothetical protein T439DRAFT_354201 [Meredithblackwellia eburnea MCA 4105]
MQLSSSLLALLAAVSLSPAIDARSAQGTPSQIPVKKAVHYNVGHKKILNKRSIFEDALKKDSNPYEKHRRHHSSKKILGKRSDNGLWMPLIEYSLGKRSDNGLWWKGKYPGGNGEYTWIASPQSTGTTSSSATGGSDDSSSTTGSSSTSDTSDAGTSTDTGDDSSSSSGGDLSNTSNSNATSSGGSNTPSVGGSVSVGDGSDEDEDDVCGSDDSQGTTDVSSQGTGDSTSQDGSSQASIPAGDNSTSPNSTALDSLKKPVNVALPGTNAGSSSESDAGSGGTSANGTVNSDATSIYASTPTTNTLPSTPVSTILPVQSSPAAGGASGSQVGISGTGHATVYTPSTSSCGWDTTGHTMVAALPANLMDGGNSNMICGATVEVTPAQGAPFKVVVVDSCGACSVDGGATIDLDSAAFEATGAPLSAGVSDCTWKITSPGSGGRNIVGDVFPSIRLSSYASNKR